MEEGNSNFIFISEKNLVRKTEKAFSFRTRTIPAIFFSIPFSQILVQEEYFEPINEVTNQKYFKFKLTPFILRQNLNVLLVVEPKLNKHLVNI
jgi:hypothetical protein